MTRNVCVYCSSSDAIDRRYFEAAADFGRLLGQRGDTLVFGGVDAGLMGAVADSARQHGAKVVGIAPQAIVDRCGPCRTADEMLVVADMRQRKAMMEARADAFVALPGGFGTLEELLEVITLKQIKYHAKPIAVLNIAGFYDPLVELFEHLYQQQFAKPSYRALYHMAHSAAAVMNYFDAYQPPSLPSKWYTQAT